MLAELQSTLLHQRIDAKRFDEMLRTGALVRVGIPCLNARLAAAIRKAWHTDFAQVQFVPYCAPPRKGDRCIDHDALDRLVEPVRCTSSPPTSVQDHSLDTLFPAKPCAPTSFAPPQPLAVNRNSASGCNEERASLADIFAPRPSAPTSFAAPAPINEALLPGRTLDNGAQHSSLAEVFAPQPNAATSFASPAFARGPNSRSSSRRGSPIRGDQPSSLADIFAPRPNAPTSFAAPACVQCPVNRSSASSTAHPSLDTVLPPRAPAKSSLVRDDRYQKPPPNTHVSVDEWAGVSLGDILKPQDPASIRFGALPNVVPSDTQAVGQVVSGSRRQRDREEWNGASLGDVFAPRKPAPKSYAGQDAAEIADATNTASLTPRSHRGSEASIANDKSRHNPDTWGGISLGDALAARPKPAQPLSSVFSQSPCDVISHEQGHLHEQQEKPCNDPWAGVSLGDALGARPKPSPQSQQCQEIHRQQRGGARATAVHTSVDGGCHKSQEDIVTWLRSLPVSHVPEQAREGIVELVEQQNLAGDAFTKFVQNVDPAVCGPKHAMKLKAAWANVLAEAAATEVCRQNLDYAANHQQKAVAIAIAA